MLLTQVLLISIQSKHIIILLQTQINAAFIWQLYIYYFIFQLVYVTAIPEADLIHFYNNVNTQ